MTLKLGILALIQVYIMRLTEFYLIWHIFHKLLNAFDIYVNFALLSLGATFTYFWRRKRFSNN